MCYHISAAAATFSDFHSVHWCNWCYKSHSKSLKQYQCYWCCWWCWQEWNLKREACANGGKRLLTELMNLVVSKNLTFLLWFFLVPLTSNLTVWPFQGREVCQMRLLWLLTRWPLAKCRLNVLMQLKSPRDMYSTPPPWSFYPQSLMIIVHCRSLSIYIPNMFVSIYSCVQTTYKRPLCFNLTDFVNVTNLKNPKNLGFEVWSLFWKKQNFVHYARDNQPVINN